MSCLKSLQQDQCPWEGTDLSNRYIAFPGTQSYKAKGKREGRLQGVSGGRDGAFTMREKAIKRRQ